MTRYKDELFHYTMRVPDTKPLRKKKRIAAEEDEQSDDAKVSKKKKLSRRQMLLQALQKNPTKIGTDADEEDESEQDLSDKPKRKKLASKSVKGKPRFPLKKASR